MQDVVLSLNQFSSLHVMTGSVVNIINLKFVIRDKSIVSQAKNPELGSLPVSSGGRTEISLPVNPPL